MNKIERIKRNLAMVENRYDSESDIGPGPLVTWADACLMLAVTDLLEVVKTQQEKIERLEQLHYQKGERS